MILDIRFSRDRAIEFLVNRLFPDANNNDIGRLEQTFKETNDETLKIFLNSLPEFKEEDIKLISELESKVRENE